ncbi:hypothetical protein, partial [Bradyrhizobium sp.]|uniref:hypothetical protein n=1 Tax=Bradyrhizobium sp. TaxID=376 RepID=UPI003C7C007E
MTESPTGTPRELLLQLAQNFCSAPATAARKGCKIRHIDENVRTVTISITTKSGPLKKLSNQRRKTFAKQASSASEGSMIPDRIEDAGFANWFTLPAQAHT